jgi:hypothetical protein
LFRFFYLNPINFTLVIQFFLPGLSEGLIEVPVIGTEGGVFFGEADIPLVVYLFADYDEMRLVFSFTVNTIFGVGEEEEKDEVVDVGDVKGVLFS